MCISSRMHSFTTDIPMYENAERSERWTWKHALNEAKAEYAWDEEPSKAWYNRRSIDRHKAGVAFGGDGHGRLSASPAWTLGWPVWKVRCHWKLVFAWQVFLDLSSIRKIVDVESFGKSKRHSAIERFGGSIPERFEDVFEVWKGSAMFWELDWNVPEGCGSVWAPQCSSENSRHTCWSMRCHLPKL